MSYQKLVLCGRVGGDPEVSYMPNGTGVAKFSLTTSERWKDKQGNKQEKTSWHRLVFFGPIVEGVIANYVKKGDQVLVDGTIDYQEWDDKASGEKKYMTSIKGQNLTLLGGKSDGQHSPRPAPQQSQQGASKDFDEDIGF